MVTISRSKRTFFRPVLLFSLALLVTITGCTGLPPPAISPKAVTLKLSWKHGVQFLGHYIAQEKGFYEAEGLAVTIEPLHAPTENAEIPGKVADGEFDFSTAGRPLVLAQTQGVETTAIATIGQLSPLTYFARTDSGIQTPADFAGHRVAMPGEVARKSLESLLAASGLTLADVEEVPTSFDMTPFYNGEVDVWIGYLSDEVIHARQQGLDLVTFPLYEYGIMYTTEGIYTSRDRVQNNPQLATRFVKASLQGWEWALDHPTEAVDIMLARFPELAAERDFYLASFDAYIPLTRPPGGRMGSIDCQRWVSDALFANLPNTEGLCTTAILEAAWAEE